MNADPLTPREKAHPPRENLDVVRSQYRSIVGMQSRTLFDALPNMVMVLNCQRQVVFANKALLSFLGYHDVEEMLGSTPGEALGCVNTVANSGRCGTSLQCVNCGAAQALLAAIDGPESCRIDCNLARPVTTDIEGLDLDVYCSSIVVDGQRFVLFVISDITLESRRRSMERIFFHDVLNLVGGISGLTEMLGDVVPAKLVSDFNILRSATESLVDEILAQRDIVSQDAPVLSVSGKTIDTLDVLRRLIAFYAHAPVAKGRTIALDPNCASTTINRDARLVQRVLGNMLKNALEALPLGGTALLSCQEEADHVVFSVHNPGLIPQSLQEGIFRKAISTKGSGRGMGTYSMLMLAERFLGGKVDFRSTEAEGTVFFLRLPKVAPAEPAVSHPSPPSIPTAS